MRKCSRNTRQRNRAANCARTPSTQFHAHGGKASQKNMSTYATFCSIAFMSSYVDIDQCQHKWPTNGLGHKSESMSTNVDIRALCRQKRTNRFGCESAF